MSTVIIVATVVAVVVVVVVLMRQDSVGRLSEEESVPGHPEGDRPRGSDVMERPGGPDAESMNPEHPGDPLPPPAPPRRPEDEEPL